MTVSRSWSLVLGLAACALHVAGAGADELLTADRAVQIALQKSPQVVNAGANVLDARSGVYSSLSGVVPHVSAGLSRSGSWTSKQQGLSFGSSTTALRDVEGYQTTPGLTASWSVLDFSGLAGLSSARQGLRAAKLSQTSARNDVALAVRRQFFLVVGAVHLAGVNAEALRLSRDNERRVRALFEVGSVSKSDVLKAQVQTAQSQLDSLTSANQITIQRIALASAIGVPEATMGSVDTTLTLAPVTYDEAAILAEAQKNRPDLMAASAELRAARSARTSARLGRFPYLTVSGSAAYKEKSETKITDLETNADNSFGTKSDAAYQASLALNWDFFDGFLTDSRNASAQAKLMRAKENYDALQRNLAAEVRQALLSHHEALESVDVAERAVESATENLKLTQQKYNVGSSTILDLIDAQVQLQRAENQRVVARAGVRVADAAIRRVSGRND